MTRRRSEPSLARLVDQLVRWVARAARPRPAGRQFARRAHTEARRRAEELHRAQLRDRRAESAMVARMMRRSSQEEDRIARRYARAGLSTADARAQAQRDLVDAEEGALWTG